jgi:hypothetical protein
MMRIRQIVFAVRDLANGRARLASLLDLDPPFRDPDVAVFGIDNAVYAFGDQFVELISPIQEGSAAGRALDRRGDCGYMLLLQTDDFERERARIAALGVRTVWQAEFADIRADASASEGPRRCDRLGRSAAAGGELALGRTRLATAAGSCGRPASGRRHRRGARSERDGGALGRGARTRSAARRPKAAVGWPW